MSQRTDSEEEFNLLSRLSDLYMKDKKFQESIINYVLRPILNDIRIKLQGYILIYALILSLMLLVLAAILVILIVKLI